ncbi:MAG: oligosaccharide flippase family protein [Bacteroidales bacterium]|nr:oligosaccharide flippase family protein [Bacteroidales bacterium]
MLAQKLILSYSSKIIVQFIQIIATIIVARIAGPTVIGTIAYCLSFVSMFIFVADLGSGTAHIKLISEGQKTEDCITTYSTIKVILTILFLFIVICAYFVQKYFLNGFESKTHEIVLFIFLTIIVIERLLDIIKTTFAANTQQAKQDIPDFIYILLYQLFRIGIVLAGYKAIALALGNFFALLIVIPLYIYLFKEYSFGILKKALIKKYLAIGIPVLLIGVATNMSNYLDKVILQYFCDSTEVGYYTAGFKIGGFILLIANSVSMLFFPLFSKAISEGNIDFIKDKINKFERFSLIFIMPVVIIVVLFSDVIVLTLLGKEYINSISILSIITVAMFFYTLFVPYGNIILGMGYFKAAAIVNIINFTCFIILQILLVHPKLFGFGAMGAAIAVLFSRVLISFMFILVSKYKCNISMNVKNLKYLLFGLSIYFISKYLLKNIISESYFYYFLFVLSFLILNYLLLYLFKMFNKTDIQYISQLLNIKELKKYIKSEILKKDL